MPAVQTVQFGGPGKKAGQDAEKFRLIEKKGVVAGIGCDLDETDRCGDGVQRMHDTP